jgi:hypothetical protein
MKNWKNDANFKRTFHSDPSVKWNKSGTRNSDISIPFAEPLCYYDPPEWDLREGDEVQRAREYYSSSTKLDFVTLVEQALEKFFEKQACDVPVDSNASSVHDHDDDCWIHVHSSELTSPALSYSDFEIIEYGCIH